VQHIYCTEGHCFGAKLLSTSMHLFCLGSLKNVVMVAFRLLHLQAFITTLFCFLIVVDYASSEVMFQCPKLVPSLVLHSDLALICWLPSVITTMTGHAAQCAVSCNWGDVVLIATESHFILLHRTKCPL